MISRRRYQGNGQPPDCIVRVFAPYHLNARGGNQKRSIIAHQHDKFIRVLPRLLCRCPTRCTDVCGMRDKLVGPMPASTYTTAACAQYTGVNDGSDEEVRCSKVRIPISHCVANSLLQGFRVNLDGYDLNNKHTFHLKRAHTVAFSAPAPKSAITRYVLRHTWLTHN